jgi:hypothetical protein
MATANDLRRLALALEGTSEHPHFDRAAFKVARIYVTLVANGCSANFKFTPDEQEFKCMHDDAGGLRAPRQCLGAAGVDSRRACQSEPR